MIKQQRLISVDFFRGITVAGMILVNNPGSWNYVYSPLQHARWHGCTPTDLIFPFFLFIVGLSINFSLTPTKEKGVEGYGLYSKILKRSLLLFGLGLLIAAFPFTPDYWSGLRIPGVLQRIAIVFLVCALVFIKTPKAFHIGFTAFLLLLYWVLMTMIPVPDGTAPNLDSGTNLAAWVDRFLLDGHLWAHSKTWDPEGVLSTLPAIATGMLGILAADFLKQNEKPSVKVNRLFIAGITLIAAGYLWSFIFPINKSLWTSSYVLFTGGLAMMVLAVCYFLIDVMEYKKAAKPFIFFGANAITVYVASELLAKVFYLITFDHPTRKQDLKEVIYDALNVSWIGPYNASLILALAWVAIFWIVAWVMFRRKIFIKV